MTDPSKPTDVCEIRVAHRLGSVVASALGDATAYSSGPRLHLRIVSPEPLALAELAGRLDALGLAVDDIRVTQPRGTTPDVWPVGSPTSPAEAPDLGSIQKPTT